MGALALALALTAVIAPPAAAQPPPATEPPWNGMPISQGFGPTYGEPWCNPAAATSEPGPSSQQGPPLALMPYGALACSLEKFQAEAAAAGVPPRMSYSVIGQSAGGRDVYAVVVNALETPEQRRDYARYQQFRSMALDDPAAAQALLATWGADVKMPVFIEANIHGNEEEGADAMMQAIRDLATTPRGVNAIVDKILDHSVLVVIPVQNPDGRFLGIRQNENRFDMNRDLLVQSQSEMRANVRVQQRWLATNGLALHGYLNPTLDDALTKPHNPGIEYDIFAYWNQRRLDDNETRVHAVPGLPGSARAGVHNGYGLQRPVNDWCAEADHPMWFTTDQSWWTSGVDPNCPGGTPAGPAVAEGWDDWGPFYTQTYISLLGIDGSTVEMCSSQQLQPRWDLDPPGQPNPDLDDPAQCGGEGPRLPAGGLPGGGGLGSKKMQYVIFYSSMDYWLSNKNAMMRDQLEIYRRGVTDADRPSCCSDPLVASRGFTEAEHNWMVPYPKAYIIPREGDTAGPGAQRSDAEANRMAKWLLDNGIKVDRTNADITWNGTTYKAGSYVVWMNQALRGLALTALSAGQDISSRISVLYAPPGAWSHGLVWGADVVEVPRGDLAFAPATTPITEPTPLQGGVRGGPGVPADWYSATIRGPIELRAILGLLRGSVDAEMAEAPFTSTTGGPMPAGTLIFPNDAETAALIHAAGQNAGIWFERNVGVGKPATSRVRKPPRIAVLVNSATPETSTTTRPIHEALETIFGSDLVGFVSTINGSNSLQNAASDPLANFDVIYNTGQAYPAAANAQARSRLQAFFARGGGYIGTSQSGTNYTFLSGAGLVNAWAHTSDGADGGIALWDNSAGSASPLTGAYPARDTLFLPDPVTFFSTLPSGAVVDGRYRDTTNNTFLAGLWRDRDVAVASAPMAVHGNTNVASRYAGLATDPVSRHDGERHWTWIGQAALWATLTDEAPLSAVNFPAAGGDYGDASWDAGCASPGICGTASSNPGPAIERVQVAVQQVSTGLWWNGTAFASATPVYSNASGTTNWSFSFPSTRFPADGDYLVRSKAITVGGNEEIAPTSRQFTFDGTAPEITIRSPANGATYSQGQRIAAGYSCSDAGGVRTCSGPVESGESINTSSTGQHMFTVTSTDQVGNQSSATVTYNVVALSCSISVRGRPVEDRTRLLRITISARNPDGSAADPGRPRITLRGAGVRKTVTARPGGVADVAVRPSRTGLIRVTASSANMDSCTRSVRVRPAPRARSGAAGQQAGGGALTGRPN